MTTETIPEDSDLGVRILELKQLPECQVQVRIEISSFLAKNHYQLAVREIGKGISLPGFRKGRAPLSYLKERCAHQIEGQWSRQLAQSALERALPLCSVQPLGENKRAEYRWEVCELEGPSLLIAHFECAPQLPEQIDVSALAIEVESKPLPPPGAVDAVLKAESDRRAHLEERAGPCQVGDLIDVSMHTRTDPPRELWMVRQCPLTKERIPSWALPHIAGLNAQERKDAWVEHPDFAEPQLCEIHLARICASTAPALDDHLAATLGFTGLQQWRERIEQILQARIDGDHRARGQQLLFDAIIKAHPFDIPRSLLERQQRALEQKERPDAHATSEEKHERALFWGRTVCWMEHWVATRGALLSPKELEAQVAAKLQGFTLSKEPQEAMRQVGHLYHTTRLTSIAERVLDDYLRQLGWFAESIAAESPSSPS